jgi:hypothetical protein
MDSVRSPAYQFSNGVNILTTVAGTYANANVASYLPTYSGNVRALNFVGAVQAQVGSSFAYALNAFGAGTDTGGVFLPADVNSNAVVAGYTIVSNAGVTLTVTSASFVAGTPNFISVSTTPTASSFVYPVTVYSADYSPALPTSTITVGNATISGNVIAPHYLFANGVNILSTVAGTYSNANVASYLLHFDGDIEFTSSTAKIGNVDVITVGAHIQSPEYRLTNGAVIRDTAGDAVAFGENAGLTSQGTQSVAIGQSTGTTSQGASAVAVGSFAGQTTQGIDAVAVGYSSASNAQSAGAVAIGYAAGQNVQGNAAVAIGYFAGRTSQGNNSIILNATGANLNAITANTFTVAPIRNDVSTANVGQVMFYNTTSNEVTYGNTINVAGNLSVAGNVVQQSAYYETYSNVTNSGGNLTCNFVNSATFYATLTANVTVNFTNVVATAGRVTGATLIVDQGATAYGVANIQINSGGIQTIKYAGGTPNTGTASNTDVMSFSLISLDGTNWRVLGQISNYG